MAGWFKLELDGSIVSRCEKKKKAGEENHENFTSKPLPPLFRDGKALDLLKLFVHVKNRGGYEAVSRDGLWEAVGEDQGLSCSGLGSAIKIVYCNYLQGFESDLMKDSDAVGMDSVDLKANGSKNEAKSEEGSTDGAKLGGVKMDSEGENVDVDSASSVLSGNQKPFADANLSIEENCSGSGKKRKRESLIRMLDWLALVAQDPTNRVIGSLPECLKWTQYDKDHFWEQVLLSREALLLKRPEGLSLEQFDLQKKQRMHPSMYEDSSERSRASRRLLSPSSLTPNCNSSENTSIFQKRIPVGPLYQAEVPKWTGKPTESDPKWLGTKVSTPMEGSPISPHTNRDPCFCQFPGSVGCVKLHVSRTRNKLRAELGIAFYRWNFEKVGEEAALYWTARDEQKFDDVVKDNLLSNGKSFWFELPKALPTKTRVDLVSYYYNVFLIRQRAFQNRYRPSEIDSDDDESEFIARSNSLILSPGKKSNRR